MAVILNASTSSGLVQTADTSGDLELQSNCSTKLTVASTGVSGTLVQGTAVASTSGTSIDFTGIPSWVKKITVMFAGVSTNGTSLPQIQLGDSGGIENTSYNSFGLLVGAAGGTAVGSATTGFVIYDNTPSASNALTGQMFLSKIDGNSWVCSLMVLDSNRSAMKTTSGAKTLSDVLTQLRITTVNGTDTFDAGTINIQYEG
jgi:hypothetical protein